MRAFLYFFSFFFILVSCKTETKKETNSPPKLEEATVVSISTPVTAQSSLPRLFSNDNQLFLSWVEKQDSLSVLKYASYTQNQWSQPIEVASGTDWFVNWADFPVIAENNGNILTSLLQKSASGTYTYDISLNLYNAKTNRWKKNFLLNQDGTQSEHGFVSMIPHGDDAFLVTWLDGRNTVNVPKEKAQMTLRSAIVTALGEIIDDSLLDNRTCDCCNTAITQTNNGAVIVYRDRSQEEIRDIYVVRKDSTNQTDPQPVFEDNWHIPGCPVNGPAIDALENDVAVVWFTAANDNPKVQVAFSNDGGATFGLPIRIDKGNAIGRVDLVMLDKEHAAVLWMEPLGNDTVIQVVKVSASGEVFLPITITKTRSERSSGFPQMELLNDLLYIAWTSLEEKEPKVKIASLNISNL